MAAISWTAGDLKIGTGTVGSIVTAGGSAISQFDCIYKNGSVYEAADTSTATKAGVVGIAATQCDASGRFFLITSGSIFSDTAVFTQGENYILDGTAGLIQPEGDKGSSEYLTTIGRAKSTTELTLDIMAFGYVKT